MKLFLIFATIGVSFFLLERLFPCREQKIWRKGAAAWSFYPGKNLGAYGDAGAVVTQDADIAGKIRSLGNYGSVTRNDHATVGFNSRLDTLQAVVLTAKLKRLAAWNEQRRQAAAAYNVLFSGCSEVLLPQDLAG